jgi:hypothetical protein
VAQPTTVSTASASTEIAITPRATPVCEPTVAAERVFSRQLAVAP